MNKKLIFTTMQRVLDHAADQKLTCFTEKANLDKPCTELRFYDIETGLRHFIAKLINDKWEFQRTIFVD